MEDKEIKVGNIVLIKARGLKGVVTGIVDYGTHVCYFVDAGKMLKYPLRREWIEPTGENVYDNDNNKPAKQ